MSKIETNRPSTVRNRYIYEMEVVDDNEYMGFKIPLELGCDYIQIMVSTSLVVEQEGYNNLVAIGIMKRDYYRSEFFENEVIYPLTRDFNPETSDLFNRINDDNTFVVALSNPRVVINNYSTILQKIKDLLVNSKIIDCYDDWSHRGSIDKPASLYRFRIVKQDHFPYGTAYDVMLYGHYVYAYR